ncbi:metallopeptidase [Desulfurococcaceae archaeon MEX13E-LK6-19]|nr:metallopeptidase [Desulfurococcaceae archaeon MEX13E-LK6-19]
MKPVYTRADDVRKLAENIVTILNDYFGHIDINRIFFVRSKGSRTTAIARIHALPRIWREVLGLEPTYIIEVVSENYDPLSNDEKIKIIIHELLHIPSRFSGGLRPHGKFVNNNVVKKLFKIYKKRLNSN